MAEHPFEREAERLFAMAPAFDDDAAFVDALETRIDRFAAVRAWLVLGLQTVGLLTAIFLVFTTGLFQAVARGMSALGAQSATAVSAVSPATWTVLVVVMGCAALLYARAERAI